MRVSRIIAPVTVLGPGRRVGLWVQGCDLACTGCASTDTWSRDGGRESMPSEVVDQLVALIDDHQLTGLTVSGGEPFQQAQSVTAVIAGVRAARSEVDVLLFTGYPVAIARNRGPTLFELADVIVAGPYDGTLTQGGPLLATSNQEMCVLTQRGRERYANLPPPRVQLLASDRDLAVIGLPPAGTLDCLVDELAHAGVVFEKVSWRP